MMRLLVGLLWAACAYVAGGLLGYVLTMGLSSNVHDREVEAAVTGALVVGPLCALTGFVAGVVRRPRSAG